MAEITAGNVKDGVVNFHRFVRECALVDVKTTGFTSYSVATNKKGPRNGSPFCGGDGGIRTLGTELSVRRFSKPLVSATHPRLRTCGWRGYSESKWVLQWLFLPHLFD
jgi:hypothetical protein